MKPVLGLTATLLTFWLLLSGQYTLLWLSFGAASVTLVVWLSRRMDIVDHEAHHLSLGLRVTGYWVWLAGAILRAAVSAVRRILSSGAAISPVMHRLPTGTMTPLAQVTYANSMTLTPGTLAAVVDDEGITVHALHPDSLPDPALDPMAARIRKLESR